MSWSYCSPHGIGLLFKYLKHSLEKALLYYLQEPQNPKFPHFLLQQWINSLSVTRLQLCTLRQFCTDRLDYRYFQISNRLKQDELGPSARFETATDWTKFCVADDGSKMIHWGRIKAAMGHGASSKSVKRLWAKCYSPLLWGDWESTAWSSTTLSSQNPLELSLYFQFCNR